MIRTIRENDKPQYLAMAKDFYGSDAVLHPVADENFEATFRELMRSDCYVMGYILEHCGETAGYAMLAKTFTTEAGGVVLWLEELYVKPEFRGRGIGGELLEYIKAVPNVARIRLEAEPENEAAMRLYRKHGFETLGYIQLIIQR